MVVGLGVPIFRVLTVFLDQKSRPQLRPAKIQMSEVSKAIDVILLNMPFATLHLVLVLC